MNVYSISLNLHQWQERRENDGERKRETNRERDRGRETERDRDVGIRRTEEGSERKLWYNSRCTLFMSLSSLTQLKFGGCA